ncbi:MAG: beta-N-acetylhexosaminidase [Ruminococcaceae bacterium]|nr:beta-N-acetylhexosaminidase [Oscillospiraceae bacterium]
MAKHKFNKFGVMIDMSRNSVMNLDSLKEFIRLIKKIGYNCVLLYTEDTYEIDDPYFGYLRGRYSKEEMKEIDAFAESIGVEMIPCIQTLAHLNAFKRWQRTPYDCEDIILTDDDRTYEFIDKMLASTSECFKSRRIHIGMDEAHMLGRGKHLDVQGYENAISIMQRHLSRVIELAKKYDYSPMMWSDMFFRSWNNGAYTIPKQKLPENVINAFNKDVTPVYWDYYRTNKEVYSDMLYNHKQLSDETWFAGGVWGWGGLVPFNELSMKNMFPAIDACREHKVKNVFMTLWGDNGGECSHFAEIPGLFKIIEYAKGNTDDEESNKKFKRIFGLDFDDFLAIDLPNQIADEKKIVNPSKYMLFSDPFAGFLDCTVKKGVGKKFEEYEKTLTDIANKSRRFGYIFKAEAKLCSVLSVKYELGVKTREAYKAHDTEALRSLLNDYSEAIKRTKEFYKAFSYMWHKDFKPHGFAVQDMRIGGLIQRLEGCKKRLSDYIDGRLSKIDELEEVILPFKSEGEPIYFNNALNSASVNVN